MRKVCFYLFIFVILAFNSKNAHSQYPRPEYITNLPKSNCFTSTLNNNEYSDSLEEPVNIENSSSEEISLYYAGSTLWSPMRCLAVDGSYAYCGFGNGLIVLDINDPSDPQMAYQLYLNDAVRCIDISDSNLYLGCSDLKIYNVCVPSSPKLIGKYKTGDYIHSVRVVHDKAYLHYDTKFEIIDISDPGRPISLGIIDSIPKPLSVPSDLEIAGNYAYLASNDVYVINISNPNEPAVVTSFDTPTHLAVNLDAEDSILYIADLSSSVPSWRSAITIMDISNPASPSLLACQEYFGDVFDVSVDGELGYVAAGACGIAVFDVSDPQAPVPVWCYSSPGMAKNIIQHNGLLFVNNEIPIVPDDLIIWSENICSQSNQGVIYDEFQIVSDSGDFQVFDISDSYEPKLIGRYPFPGYSSKITLNENYAFVSDDISGTGIFIVDISNPDTMVMVSSLKTPGCVYQVAVSGDLLLAGDMYEGLQIANISDIAKPRIVSNYKDLGYIFGVSVRGDYAYVAAGSKGLAILDISDPILPSYVGHQQTLDFAINVIVSGDYAFVADRYAGIQVMDISNPAAPFIVASFPDSGDPCWIAEIDKHDNTLVGCGGSKVYIIDIENPANPIEIGKYVSSDLRDIIVTGDYICLARTEKGIELIDISVPALPEMVAKYDTRGFAMGLAFEENQIYIADYYSLIRLSLPVTTDIKEEDRKGSLPDSFRLMPNFPNPFNSTTAVEYDLPKKSSVRIHIYNVLGQRVNTIVDQMQFPGRYMIQWDGTDKNGNSLSSGIYFLQLRTDNLNDTKKMLLLK